jgi:hypothetical protein
MGGAAVNVKIVGLQFVLPGAITRIPSQNRPKGTSRLERRGGWVMSIVSGHPSSHEDAVYDEGLFRPDDDQLDLFALSRESNPRAERFARSGDPTEAAGGAAGHAMAAATSAGNQKAKPSGAIEDDMRRLAESVRWLQSETSACRLPRAAQLPAVDGLPALGADRYFDDPIGPGAGRASPGAASCARAPYDRAAFGLRRCCRFLACQ